ncbi:hypothetical protein A2130_00510 [Candidatus Woesebacteria bacterium GWC2_33_12]|uniref:Competence protein F n=1 Tax=Candidatus Woesebacteria bacterium GW2011_GWB1_33_22 TaxID=1618566 RepID=A0A0F9ZIH6_9BACT|nr:MAG: competence protein F [Candidatus Woesebacteria bacterium GW2011_GWC2_33_12]KKP41550.1 MAG: competence protein F [Candidatus Woesebacteria bacterium GW2011_GWA2_33_20]KKP44003.1 MAG: competence protein F [Candidatus Woesebacteria bacterium GW2011_GWB1_33_22]KKP46556.1 MAG: competence protein F [Microgenomates group bacterium GW2011_GWC1_33_28]KKP49481.1 MAG: competence protein F [Candidatus Woesebacteria bacterium GW2011_GWA1_33_33]OGM07699.1 MAG: hypothetical protein A2130_00510 [Candi
MILDFLFPKYCLQCKKPGKYICDDCYCKVRPCNIIDNNNYSIFKYEGVIRRAIISLKYKFAYDIVDELVNICVKKLTFSNYFLNSTLVSIPLHKHRENWRGFNQAEIIGEKLANKMNWKYFPDLLIRTKETISQVGLKGLARRQNLSGVFSIGPHYSLITNHYSLVLFDDVYTTGSTINEAKKVLQETGFKNIKSLTIAR